MDQAKFVDDDTERQLDRAAEVVLHAHADAYDQLPLPIQLAYSRNEWNWLSDDEKVSLVRRECEPQW